MAEDDDIVPTYEELNGVYQNGGGIRITHPQKQARHKDGLFAVYGYALHRVLRLLRKREVAAVPGAPWGYMLNRWGDHAGVMHSLNQDGSPRCGARYHASAGQAGDYEQSRGPKCKRCLRAVKEDT